MKSYKDLKCIEQTFRELKDIIEIRPISHHKNIRVEGHVFVCVLSILTRRLMSKNLAETNEIINELKEIKAVEDSIGDEKYCFMTKLTNKQKGIFEKLGVEEPIKYL
jgi:transposase